MKQLPSLLEQLVVAAEGVPPPREQHRNSQRPPLRKGAVSYDMLVAAMPPEFTVDQACAAFPEIKRKDLHSRLRYAFERGLLKRVAAHRATYRKVG